MAKWSPARAIAVLAIALGFVASVILLGLLRSDAVQTASGPSSPGHSATTAGPVRPGAPTATSSPSHSALPSPLPTADTGPTAVPETSAPLPSGPPPEPPAPPQTGPAPPLGIPADLLGVDLERIPTNQRIVALTFDAGANDAALRPILSTLASAGVPGTFFLTGAWANQFPSDVTAIVAGGHRVGNHSMTHPPFTSLTDAQIAAQLANAQAAIESAGADPRPLFRFPSGDRDARTIADVNAAGYAAIRWTVDTLGWQGTMNGTRGPSFIVQRVMAAAQPGEIVLMHIGSNPDDGSTLDADALPQIIAQLRAAGYAFVTLDAALG